MNDLMKLSLVLPVLLVSAATVASGADAYLLGPQDTLRVKVYEWRASQDKIVEWEGLNDEFTVSADGTISLPMVGDVVTTGKTPQDIAGIISDRLQQRMNLADPPDASVEVTKYRPIYVVGDVMKPGDFPFRPGMMVVQAVSLAGGVLRTASQAREVITVQGELAAIALQRDALIAKQARLNSEVIDSPAIRFPPSLQDRQRLPHINALMEQETLIFNTRAEAYHTQTSALSDLKTYLEKEVASLTEQMELEVAQANLVNRELDGVSALVAKGFATAPRQYALERSKVDIQGSKLRLEAQMLRARQEFSRADISILELKSQRQGNIALELRETEQKLQELQSRGKVAERLLGQTSSTVDARRQGRPAPTFTILRAGPSGTMPAIVSDVDAVLPGDTIMVALPAFEASQALAPSDEETLRQADLSPVLPASAGVSN